MRRQSNPGAGLPYANFLREAGRQHRPDPAVVNPWPPGPAWVIKGLEQVQVSGPRGPFEWAPMAQTGTTYPFVNSDTSAVLQNDEPSIIEPEETLVYPSTDVSQIFTDFGLDEQKIDTLRVSLAATNQTLAGGAPLLLQITFAESEGDAYQISGIVTRPPVIMYLFRAFQLGGRSMILPFDITCQASITFINPPFYSVDGPIVDLATQLCSFNDRITKEELGPFLPALSRLPEYL